MSLTLFCHLKSDLSGKDAIIMQLFEYTDLTGCAREREQEVIGKQIMNKLGIGQPVLAIFKNGIVYKFAPGRKLRGSDLKDPKVIRYIGKFTHFINKCNLYQSGLNTVTTAMITYITHLISYKLLKHLYSHIFTIKMVKIYIYKMD